MSQGATVPGSSRRFLSPDDRPDMLPPDVDLVGRDDDLLRLQNLLASHKATYGPRRMPARIFIHGVAGVGKSALGAKFAHRLAEDYPAGVLYVDLNYSSVADDALNVPQILRDFLLNLGSDHDQLPQDPGALHAEFIKATDGRRLIVFLDNVRDFHEVVSLLPRSSSCLLIVTSQERLDQNIQSLELRPLTEEAAVSLFTSIAPSRIPLTNGDERQLADVLEACVGLPIAIIVLAARLEVNPAYSLTRILADLGRTYSQLNALFGVKSRKVVACFRVGYDSLTDSQAVIFRRLGVALGESFDIEMIAFLGNVARDEAQLILEQLRELQLIQPTQDSDFFTIHSLLKDFAREQLGVVEAGEQLRRVLDYYRNLAEKNDLVIRSAGPAHKGAGPNAGVKLTLRQRDQALECMEKQHKNLVAAVERACEVGELDIAWRTCRALVEFFEIRGKWESWRQTHEAAEKVVPARSGGSGYVSYGLARFHGSRHNWPEAIGRYRVAITIFLMHDDQPQVGLGLRSLGDAYRYSRNWDAAENCFRRSLRILESVNDLRQMAIAKRSLAAIHRVRGEFDEGKNLCRQAIETLQGEGDDRWVAAAKLSLADLCLDCGDEDARTLLNECLSVFEIFQDTHWLTLTRRSLADAMREDGEYESALAELVKCRDSVRRERDVLWEGEVLHSMGLVYLAQKNLGKAVSHFTEALAKFRQSKDTLWEGRTLVSLGLVAAAEDRDEDSRASYYEAWPLLVEQGAVDDIHRLERLINGAAKKPG